MQTEEEKYFHHVSSFKWPSLLEENARIVKQELLTIIDEPAQHGPNRHWLAAHPGYAEGEHELSISWKTYEFLFFGIKHKTHCEKCPETWKLLQQVPELVTAQFSMMEPHTIIHPHKGYTRMVLRSHLGLIIPENCGLKVGDETRCWEEEKLLIFDDSYEHEAWNNSHERRVVLMFDFAKPSMGYTADEICRWKLERIDDPFLLNIADNATWLEWYEKGYLPV